MYVWFSTQVKENTTRLLTAYITFLIFHRLNDWLGKKQLADFAVYYFSYQLLI